MSKLVSIEGTSLCAAASSLYCKTNTFSLYWLLCYMHELVTYFRKVCIHFWHVNGMCIRGEITPEIILKSSWCYNFVCKPGINTRPLDSGSGNVHALWTVNCFRRWSFAVFSSSSVQPRSGEPIRFWLTE